MPAGEHCLKRPVFFVFLNILLVFHDPALALMPTDDKLRRAESDHFIYIYQAALEGQLAKLIGDCEDAYDLLTPIFQWVPREKVIVLFSDGYDLHNGWAKVHPRPTMMIFAADALPGSTIYEPGNYLRRTVFHEFTHLLSMDPQYGFDGVLNRIFGRVLSEPGDPLSWLITFFAMPPGAVAPTWFIEGLAMWSETEMAGPGRGRNTLVDMIFRVATAEEKLLPPTRWNLNQPEWPFGISAYVYGMKMNQYVHEKYGHGKEEQNVIGELSISAADSFPFIFNRRAYPVTEQTFSELAWKTIDYEEDRQKDRIRRLAEQPFTELERLTPPEIQAYHPRFDHAGQRIIFSGAREEQRDTLYLFNVEKEVEFPQRLYRARADGSFSNLAPGPDRSSFYYMRLDSPRREKWVSQLYRYDVSLHYGRKITGAGRYRFPAVSPDGMKLAAVRVEAGRQVLLEVPLAKAGDRESERILVKAPFGSALVDPVYAPDRSTLVYILSDETSSQIRRINLESGEDVVLVEWSAIITSPAFHPEGRELVFVSDKNGVYNLYGINYRSHASPAALTHVLGGVFQPDFSPDGRQLAVSAYDSKGYYLSILDYDTGALDIEIDTLPVIEPAWTTLELNRKRKNAVVEQKKKKVEITDSWPYQPYRNVRRNYWSPWLNASPDGAEGGFFSNFSDPVNRHELMILGGVESEHWTPLASVVYDYARFEPILTLYGFHNQAKYYNLLYEEINDNTEESVDALFHDYDEEIGGVGATLTFPFERADRSVYLSLGYQWARSRAITEIMNDSIQPIIAADLFEGEESTAWMALEYFSGTAFRRSHSVEAGRHLSMAVERMDEDLGGELNRTRALGGWSEYVTFSWNHVLKLEGHYGVSSGDRKAQSAFGLGGFSDTVAASTPGMPRTLMLRGYEQNTQVGTDIVKAGAAYRFPIFRFFQNVNATSPLYLHQIFGEVFYEGGRATGAELPGEDGNGWINACGVEVNIAFKALRWLDIAPGLGIVYAADRTVYEHADNKDANDTSDILNEKWQIYISLKSVVNF